jgi:hypothetical protein
MTYWLKKPKKLKKLKKPDRPNKPKKRDWLNNQKVDALLVQIMVDSDIKNLEEMKQCQDVIRKLSSNKK